MSELISPFLETLNLHKHNSNQLITIKPTDYNPLSNKTKQANLSPFYLN